MRDIPACRSPSCAAWSPRLIAQTTAYLHRFGFSHTAGGILTQSYRGTIGSAEHALHTTVSTYRKGRISFHSPGKRPALPAGIARHVQLVTGLDTYPRNQPLTTLGTCSAAVSAQTLFSAGLTAQQLASANGYNAQSLLDAGDDGSGEVIDFVEYATYNPSDITTYESCYGSAMTGPVSQMSVNGGTASKNGLAEVELDDDVALSLAPKLDHIYNYAASSADQGQIIDRMLSDAPATHVTQISTSWGGCEPLEFNGEIADIHTALELAAVAGIPVFAAAGDDGLQGCLRQGYTGEYAILPAADPYATAVGGTTLNISTAGANHETVWGTPATEGGEAGGSGISMLYPMPTWQTGTGVIESGISSKSKCGQTATYCREVPDVSMDANYDTGSIIYCGLQCDSGFSGWQVNGGTSEAAPMLAALVADANTYSLAHGGTRLGFANPFFYGEAGTSLFHDITVGSNAFTYSGHSFAGYPAGTGYDVASGLGTIDANQLALDVLSYTNPGLGGFDTTHLTSAESRSTITPGRGSVLSGVLTDQTSGLPLAGKPIVITGFFIYNKHEYTFTRFVLTDAQGRWAINATTKSVGGRMQWQAVYPGDEGVDSAVSSSAPFLYVKPKLTFTTSANHSSRLHAYVVAHGRGFTVGGTSNPNMRGLRVTLEFRTRTSQRWRLSTIHPTVGKRGSWATRISVANRGTVFFRWYRKGSKSGVYVSTASASKKFLIT